VKMFSLWICPDCRMIGKRVSVKPCSAGSLVVMPDGNEALRKGATPVVVSGWVCQLCGQIGELCESRQSMFGEIVPGAWGKMPRRLPAVETMDIDHRLEKTAVFMFWIVAPCILGWIIAAMIFE